MRLTSTASRFLISAVSIALVRLISRLRISRSEAMREAATACSCAIRAVSVASRARDLGAFRAPSFVRSPATRVSCSARMRCAAISFSLAIRAALHRMQRGDLGLVDRLVAGDGRRADPLLLDDAGGLHQFLRGDDLLLDGAVADDLARQPLFLRGEAIGGDRAVAGDFARFRWRAVRRYRPPRSNAASLDVEAAKSAARWRSGRC